MILSGRLHKLGKVEFLYTSGDYMLPWKFQDDQNRLQLDFIPFAERLARTDLKLIFSEVHQMFGRYSGHFISDEGKEIRVENLIGFAEEHHARW
jgi:hypothetical protein